MESLVHNLIKATGWSILHSLWQGALIYGLVLLIQMTAVHLKAKTKYMLAFAANSLLLLCFVSTFLLAFDWSQNGLTQVAGTPAVQSAALIYVPSTLSQYAEMAFPYLVCFYAVGLLVQSVMVWSGYRKISKLKKGPHQQIPENWNVLFESLTKKMGITKKVTFWLSAQVQVPLIIGYLKPVVLFPVALATQMDLQQVEAILIHELSHIRRNDYLFNLIRTMIDTVLFFNPFIWLIGKFIDIEREHACDDLVVNMTKTPMTYAHALLKLELLSNKAHPALTLAATGNKQYLYQRIKRITDMKTNYMNSKQKFFAITLTIATLISLAWIKPSKAEATLKMMNIKDHQNTSLLNAQLNKMLIQDALRQTDPADTSKKKLKKKLSLKNKSAQDSLSKVACNDTDSTLSVTINSALKPLEGMFVKIDSITNTLTINNGGNKDASGKVEHFQHPVVIKDLNGSMLKGKTIKNGMGMAMDFKKLSAEDQKKIKSLQKEMVAMTKKMQIDLSPIDKVKMEQIAKGFKVNLYSQEQLAQLNKMGANLAAVTMKIHKIVGSADLNNRLMLLQQRGDLSFGRDTSYLQDQEIRQSKEYKALKNKFDADVKALKEKKSDKNKN